MIRTYDRTISPLNHQNVTQDSRFYGFPEWSNGFFVERSAYYFRKGQGIYRCKDLHDVPDLITHSYISEGREIRILHSAISRDRNYVAISFKPEDSTLMEIRVVGIEGKIYKDHIYNVLHSEVRWYKDGFFYTSMRKLHRGYKYDADPEQEVRYHKLGTLASADAVIFYRKSRPEDELNAMVSYDEKYLCIRAKNKGQETYSLLYKSLSDSTSKLSACISATTDRIWPVEVYDGMLYILRYPVDQPNGRMDCLPLTTPSGGWHTLIPTISDAYIMSADMMRDKIVINYELDRHHDIAAYDYQGRMQHLFEMPVGERAVSVGAGHFDTAVCFYKTSITVPPTVDAFGANDYTFKTVYTATATYHTSRYKTEYKTCTSADGKSIPLVIYYSEHTKLTKHNPVVLNLGLLNGAAPFNTYDEDVLAFMDMGGIYAEENVRGGHRPSVDWEREGRKEGMEHALDDIHAGISYMRTYTDSQHIALIGGEQVATEIAALVMRYPSLVRACVLIDGTYDLLREDTLLRSADMRNKYGAVADSQSCERLYRLSPYQHTVADVQYPAIYLASNKNYVVPSQHSMKLAAKMQLQTSRKNTCLLNLIGRDDRAFKLDWNTYEDYNNFWRFIYSELAVKHW